MTILTRFLRPWRALKCISSSANRGLHHPRGGPCQNLLLASSSSNSEFPGFFSMSSLVFLAGSLGGMGFIEIAHAADANDEEETSDIQTPPTPTLGYNDAEKIVRQERLRIEELLKNQGLLRGSYPPFTVAFKGQKVTVKFRIPPTCEVSHLIASLVSHLGLKAEGRGGGSDMLLRAWESTIAWQLILNQPKKKQVQENANAPEDKVEIDKDLCILVFQSLINSEDAEIEFIKEGSFSLNELEALVAALKLAGSKVGTKRTSGRTPRGYSEGQDNKTDSPRLPEDKSITALEAMGVRVFGFNELHSSSSIGGVSWENIAGYDMQKREIEDTILLALHSPEVYDDIARGTRCKFESNRARAVLFEGPPGTGKTSCARVIANQAGVPLLYVPLEVVMSKYYGESERLLGNVFSLANELSEGALIFLDEVDSFAIARDDGMHEATRRILSVLLRQIDGFEQEKKVVVIAATNRKEDLDPALISRFDSIITFELPDQQTREQIAAQYAKHLKKSELVEFAKVLEEMSGRDIRDVCQQAERRWASKIIRGQARTDSEQGNLPPLQEYIESALDRQKALLSIAEKKKKKHNIPNSAAKEMPLAFL